MASQFQMYSSLAQRQAAEVTQSRENWQSFLDTAARLYKYPFPEQLMIYSQRPDATSCASFEDWNNAKERKDYDGTPWRRRVRQGSKGIAIIDDTSGYPRIKWVFDISDTVAFQRNNTRPYIWDMRVEHEALIMETLAKTYDDISGDFGTSLRSVAEQLADEYYQDNARDIMYSAAGSFLEDYDEYNLGVTFREALTVSVAYSLMSRCNVDMAGYFEDEEFQAVFDFNTPAMVYALGTAVNELSKQVLRDIELTIKKYERQKTAERSAEYERERNDNVLNIRGLSDSRYNAFGAAEGFSGADRQIRQNETEVSERTPDDHIQHNAAERDAVPPSPGDRGNGGEQNEADNGGMDGEEPAAGQGDRPDRLGGDDGQSAEPVGGSGVERSGLRVEPGEPPGQTEKSELQAEEAPPEQGEPETGGAFSMPAPEPSTYETAVIPLSITLASTSVSLSELDAILRDGGNEEHSLLRIAAFFMKDKTPVEKEDFLAMEYLSGRFNHRSVPGGKGFVFSKEKTAVWFGEQSITIGRGDSALNAKDYVVIGWEQAAHRVQELLNEGRYIPREMLDEAIPRERYELADDLLNLYRDFREWRETPEGWQVERGGWDDDVENLKKILENPNEREKIITRLESDIAALRTDPDAPGRLWHSPIRALDKLRTAHMPSVQYPSNDIPAADFSRFITEDEIDAFLTKGGPYNEGKFSALSFFLNDHTPKERENFIKETYGNGGGSHALSGADDSWYSGMGGKLKLTRGDLTNPYATVELNWRTTATRINKLIHDGRYMTRSELERVPEYERIILARSINNFFTNQPEEIERPFPKELNFFYPHEAEWQAISELLDNPFRVDGLLETMCPIYENTPKDDRYHDLRENIFADLTAYKDGSYTLFPGLSDLPEPVSPETRSRKPSKAPKPEQMTLFDSAPPAPVFTDIKPFPTEAEQQAVMEESVKKSEREAGVEPPSIDSMPITQEETDALLIAAVENAEDKRRLAAQFETAPRSREASALVKEIYSRAEFTMSRTDGADGYMGILGEVGGVNIVKAMPYNTPERPAPETITIPWPKLHKRLTELAEAGRFAVEQTAEITAEPDVSVEAGNTQNETSETIPSQTAEKPAFTHYERYLQMKADNPGMIAAYQIGNFFEFFGEDAITAARVLNITLTSRDIGQPERVPMCGIPEHSLEDCVDKLREAGHGAVLSIAMDNGERRIHHKPAYETRPVGQTVLMPTVFNDQGNLNRELKRRKVKVAEPIGKYQMYTRDGNYNVTEAYVMTDSGRLIYWSDTNSYRYNETELDRVFSKAPEYVDTALRELDKWIGYNEAAIADRIPEAEAHNKPIWEASKERDAARRAAHAEAYEAETKAREEAFNGAVDSIAGALVSGERAEVSTDFEKNPLLALFALYEINVPLATKGWINRHVKALQVKDGQMTVWGSAKEITETFNRVIYELRYAVTLTPPGQQRGIMNASLDEILADLGNSDMERAGEDLTGEPIQPENEVSRQNAAADETAEREISGVEAQEQENNAVEPDQPDSWRVRYEKEKSERRPYAVGDTVYLENNTAFNIERISEFSGEVQLLDPTLVYPIFRSEPKEQFERLLERFEGNERFTDHFTADLGIFNADIRDILANGVLTPGQKANIVSMLESNEGNSDIERYIHNLLAAQNGEYVLETGETSFWQALSGGIQVAIDDKFNTKQPVSWYEAAKIFRSLHRDKYAGFVIDADEREPEPNAFETESAETEQIITGQETETARTDGQTTEAETVQVNAQTAEPEANLSFEEISRRVLDRVMRDESYLEELANADSRSMLRTPCDEALNRSIMAHAADEPHIYNRYYSDEDFSDELFLFVLRESFASKTVEQTIEKEAEPPIPDTREAERTEPQISEPAPIGQNTYYEDEDEPEERFSLTTTSDAFEDPEDAYAIWDEQTGTYYADDFGDFITFADEAGAKAFLDELRQEESQSSREIEPPSGASEPPARDAAPAAPSVPKPPNFRITDDHLGEGGAKTKFRNNIEAIETLQTLEREKRYATPAEQEVLSRYVGWGGLPQAFDPDNQLWVNECIELNNLLSPKDYDSARASTLNAHYTSPAVINAIYETVGRLGFKNGNILEPSCGVGNFFGLLPESMAKSKLYGAELDSVTARIAKHLYPGANIQPKGFEQTEFSDNFFDLAIGNVPFGDYGVADRRYDRHNLSIHNYFFAKTMDQVRPGGIVAFLTSKYTLDSKNPEARKLIAQKADLLGAVRLPNNAFLRNAGTEVTTDLIILQKRDRPADREPDWVHLGLTDNGIPVNRYFASNPEMILGTMALDKKMNDKFGRDDVTTCLPVHGADLSEQLKMALANVRGQYTEEELDDIEGIESNSIPADPSVKNFSYTLVDGEVYFRENSSMYPIDLPLTTLGRIAGMVGLRNCVHELINLQLYDYGDEEISAKQAELNTLYDAFSAEYGLINSVANSRAFSDDSAYYLLCALEVMDEDGNLERKADMFTQRTINRHREITHVDTPAEALAVSLAEKAKVDIRYMAQLTDMTPDEILHGLYGVVFCDFGNPDRSLPDFNPETMEIYDKYPLVTADEYLSGNIREKLDKARKFNELAGDMFCGIDTTANVQALQAAQLYDLEPSEISVRLGATWVDPKYVKQFVFELLQPPSNLRKEIDVNYSEFSGEWQVSGKARVPYNNVNATIKYGTSRINAYEIIDDTLNLRDVRVYDYIEDDEGKEKRVLNKKETTLAQQKQEAIKAAFKEWIWQDPVRRQTLVKLYNERFNCIRPRQYDGSHINFVGMNALKTLAPHQKNAVARILYGGNTLLAQVVGAGKSYEMIAACMEARRLGLVRKNMLCVPNHLTEQMASEFMTLYPSANILVAKKKDFEKRNRQKFCAKIATGDYDAVIIGHTQLEKIPLSQMRQERQLWQQIHEIEQGVKELQRVNGAKFNVKQMEKTKARLQARLKKLLEAKKKDDVVTFEQLGVDRLYVDESHSFKNLALYTKMRNVAGVSTTEAQKSSDLYMKCRFLEETTGGKGIVFATGTPISNSMTELYTVQRYLQHGELKRLCLLHFDSWASTFGETVTSLELAPEGSGYRARTRFAKFYNLPELMNVIKEVADIQTADMLNLPVPEAKYETVVAEPSELQKEMVADLSERAGKVHRREVEPTQDNMLKITTDGRKIGLDQRLANSMLPDNEESKLNVCANNVFNIWEETQADRLTQLVFSDFSTPKGNIWALSEKQQKAIKNLSEPEKKAVLDRHVMDTARDYVNGIYPAAFNVYDDLKAKLILKGVPASEVVFIHDADTETQKKELFAKVRQGKVRVLLGSTFKMGAGTNVRAIRFHTTTIL